LDIYHLQKQEADSTSMSDSFPPGNLIPWQASKAHTLSLLLVKIHLKLLNSEQGFIT